jgi:hypothetical protein
VKSSKSRVPQTVGSPLVQFAAAVTAGTGRGTFIGSDGEVGDYRLLVRYFTARNATAGKTKQPAPIRPTRSARANVAGRRRSAARRATPTRGDPDDDPDPAGCRYCGAAKGPLLRCCGGCLRRRLAGEPEPVPDLAGSVATELPGQLQLWEVRP